ncbi:MAG: hypothetical protein ACLQHF_16555 [Terracidiphilus sp.]
MPWARLFLIVVGAGVLSSLTDWFFAGDWIHKRFTYPEIWRKGAESRAITLTSPLPFITCGVFVALANHFGLHTFHGLAKFAIALWLLGPLPLILTNAAFIKMHRVFVACYATGWLVKLMIVAMAVGLFLH